LPDIHQIKTFRGVLAPPSPPPPTPLNYQLTWCIV